jgi:subfamily B ATP-binding cassette protein MsbA
VIALAAMLTSALTEPAIPALLKPLLDRGFTQGALPIWIVPVVIIVLFTVRGIAQFASKYALSRVAADGMVAVRQQLFDRLLHADLSLFGQQSASQLANTIVYEVQIGSSQLVQAFLNLARDGLTVVALLAYLIYLNWKLTLIVLVLVPVVAVVLKVLSRRLYKVTRESQTATDELAYVVEENVLAHRMVRLHAAQAQQAARFEVLSRQLRNLALKATRASAASMPIAQIITALALSIIIAIALSEGQGNPTDGVTVGGFVAFIGAILMLVGPTRRLADIINPITRGVAALERGIELMDSVHREVDAAPAHARTPERARGDVTLKRVDVRYNDDTAPALDAVDLHVSAGETVALVGPSGAGKTTLVNLLPRFVQASSGQVLLDGTDIADWPLAALRNQFALVSQEVTMFDDSVAANVALGAREIDRARVQRCLEQANLAEHVAALPHGIDTHVGHNATTFSGGQRQRLAIARALYKDAPILLLDEATSALDTQSEHWVQEALEQAMKGRTTLVIAHRLSTINHADRIIVMDHGRIVEQGTHVELMKLGGLYVRLHGSAAAVAASATAAE